MMAKRLSVKCRMILASEDVDFLATKEQADTLKGVRLYAARDQLPSLPDDEYY